MSAIKYRCPLPAERGRSTSDYLGAALLRSELASNNTGPLASEDRGLVAFDALIVRGSDYYTSTVFVVFDIDPANSRSLFGGGRYHDLTQIPRPMWASARWSSRPMSCRSSPSTWPAGRVRIGCLSAGNASRARLASIAAHPVTCARCGHRERNTFDVVISMLTRSATCRPGGSPSADGLIR
jgi:hypothetical protein